MAQQSNYPLKLTSDVCVPLDRIFVLTDRSWIGYLLVPGGLQSGRSVNRVDVRFWHKADIAEDGSNVRIGGYSGH
jgi:hypothetical protein